MDIPVGFVFDGAHPRQWVIRQDNNLYGLKDSGLAWFEKIEEFLADRGFIQSQVDPCVWYKEEIVLLLYVDYCLMFSPSKDKIEEVYASLQT